MKVGCPPDEAASVRERALMVWRMRHRGRKVEPRPTGEHIAFSERSF